jgi:hypothetical protein
MRSERGNWVANYDASPGGCKKSLRCQFGRFYDQKKVGNNSARHNNYKKVGNSSKSKLQVRASPGQWAKFDPFGFAMLWTNALLVTSPMHNYKMHIELKFRPSVTFPFRYVRQASSNLNEFPLCIVVID